jgi:hypothetical protein
MPGTGDVRCAGHHRGVEATLRGDERRDPGHGQHHSRAHRKGKSSRVAFTLARVVATHSPEIAGRVARIDFLRKVAMVGGSPPANKGKRESMSVKTPHERDVKKVAKMSMKENGAAKREKREPSTFIKPRKAARA